MNRICIANGVQLSAGEGRPRRWKGTKRETPSVKRVENMRRGVMRPAESDHYRESDGYVRRATDT